MRLWQQLLGRGAQSADQRMSVDEYAELFSWPYLAAASNAYQSSEDIAHSFAGYVQGAYQRNGVIFAITLARLLLFTEARFLWQDMRGSRPGELFGNRELAVLETPWPNAQTGHLLARMEQDATLGGNFYAVRERRAGQPSRLRRLRPDWVTIALSAPPAEAVESDIVGYAYHPGVSTVGGIGDAGALEVYLPDEIMHYAPIPDPAAQYRGMSWLTPAIPEIEADGAATEHKRAFFRNGATLGFSVTLPESVTPTQFTEFVKQFRAAHQGVVNAYEPLFFGAGADVKTVGADLKQLDFKTTQGAGETRLCAMAAVPPIIVGLSEGLESATFSNYASARRKFGDHWARPSWRIAAGALESVLVKPRANTRLWYDASDIAFLREDEKDRAEIAQVDANIIRSLTDAGYTPSSAAAAVLAGYDWSLLEHTGLYSVQLQKPGGPQPQGSDSGEDDVDDAA